MPSDVARGEKRRPGESAGGAAGADAAGAGSAGGTGPEDPAPTGAANETAKKELTPLPEPPSVKMVVRLFLIPLLIAAAVIAIMIPIGRMAGGPATLEGSIDQLERGTGGGRTADLLVGPAAKQRYVAAQTLSNRLREEMAKGMPEARRIELSDKLLQLLENHTQPGEGQVQHFVLLALGRIWQVDPSQGAMDSPEASAARRRVLDAVIGGGDSPRARPAYVDLSPADGTGDARRAAEATRKAAVLAMALWAGRPEAKSAVPVLVRKMKEDPAPDVHIAAATALGPIAAALPAGAPERSAAREALAWAMRNADAREVELVWAAAGSLAQMNDPECKDVILMLLDRQALAQREYYDRETDPDNPVVRKLSEEEQQRVLINTMQCAVKLDVPEVQARLRSIADNDPSSRVRAAGKEMIRN